MNKAELTGEQHAALEKVKQAFADWRETKTGRARIPDSLWLSAADLFHSFGLTINKIARSLRLNYAALKTHIVESPPVVIPATEDAQIQFVELAPPQVHSDCVIELEKQSGVKMRMCFRGRADPAVIDLGRYFLGNLP